MLQGNYPSTAPVAVGRVAISLAVACSIPLQLFPARVCWANVARQIHRLFNSLCARHPPPVTAVASGATSAQARTTSDSESLRASLLPAGSECKETSPTPAAGGDLSYGPMYFAVSITLFAIVWAIAFFVDSLGLVFELVGATASTSMAYILPGLYTFRLFSDRPRVRFLGAVYVVLGVAIAGLSLTGVAKKLVFPED